MSLLALLFAGEQGESRPLNFVGAGAIAPTTAAAEAVAAAAQRAAAAAAQAKESLARAATALAAARQAQQAAVALAVQPTLANGQPIASGVGSGGLMPSGGVTDVTGSNSCGTSCTTFQLKTPDSFKGADSKLTQTLNGGRTTVNVTQTQQQAIYNWDSFNISSNTALNFTQRASTWVALNRVNPDVSPALFLQNATSNNGHNNPSYIGGQITAPGAVYVINRNGIIFGGGAQINVASFVGSTLDVGKLGYDQIARDQYFLNTGIGNQFSFSLFDSVGGATSTVIPGNVTVEAGASITANITTDVVPLGSPGFIYLFGANVYNYGTLTAPQGEIAMAASRAITLTPGSYLAANFPSNVLPSGVTFRGTGLQLQNYGKVFTTDNSGNLIDNKYYRDDANHIVTGEITDGGVIDTRQGVVALAGDRVAVTILQDSSGSAVRDASGNLIAGVISADTSITRNSMVLMHAATSVKMDGVISTLPYDDGNTLPLLSGAASGGTASTVQSYMPPYVEMSAQGSVTLGASGLVSAPSAAVSLNAVLLGGIAARQLFNGNGGSQNGVNPSVDGPQQVILSGSGADGLGATIDVAGLQDVVLPAFYNFISFKGLGHFADMPLERNGVLDNQTLWIDIRASGTRSDGTTWVGTPLADASGVVGAVGRSINQLMTSGGSVSLTTDLANASIVAPNQVIANNGSVINVAGGKITFLPGLVSTTRLIGSDGRIYSMANADPNISYVGIAGQFTVDHSRWGVTETWVTGSQYYSPGYTEGHDAGGVTVTTVSPQIDLGGQMHFGSLPGERQVAMGLSPSDTTDSTSGTALTRPTPLQAKGDELPSQGYLTITTPSAVQIGPTGSSVFNVQDPVTQLSAETLSGYGLSALAIKAYDLTVSTGSSMRLAPGGSLSAAISGAIDVAGTISAAGGTINLSTDRYNLKSLGTNSPKLQAPTDPVTGAVIAANVSVEGSLDVSGRFVNDTGRFGTDAQGPAFVNGGSISITTNKDSASINGGSTYRDLTGSILLASGSVLDVSSGGYISPLGRPKLASTDVMAGKGGSISLALDQGSWASGSQDFGNPQPPSPESSQAALQLDGTMLAYGFENNGSLRLGAADVVRIGGTLQSDETSIIRIGQGQTLPAALLTSGGFGSYTVESIKDGYTTAGASITVSAGVNLNLQQSNYSQTFNYIATPTGTNLGEEAQQAPSTRLALLPDDRRKPVNLTLKADNALLDSGSSIVTDPKATITLDGSPKPGFAQNDPQRDQTASSVRLRGSIVDHGGSVSINAVDIRLDSWNSQQQARIDLSGIFIPNSLFGQPGSPSVSGTVIPGGTFSIEAASLQTFSGGNGGATYGVPPGGSVVAESGLQVDVSGYAGVVQISVGRATSSTWLWSDAGIVSIDVGGLAWSGNFAAVGGRLSDGTAMRAADGKTTVANNGTIILGGGQVALQQDSTAVIAALASFHQSKNTIGPGSIFVSADELAPFDTVFLYSGGALGGAGRIFTDLPGNTVNLGATALRPFTIANSLDWHVASRLHIAASSIKTGQDGSSVVLDAPYVLLTGGGDAVRSGSSTMTVTAQTIDIEGAALSGFKEVQLESSGDIRLSAPKVANSLSPSSGLVSGPSSFAGTLATNGDLLLSAQRIYPVSAVDFTIKSTAGNVTFQAPAQSITDLPLSAGGSLTVLAANIDQGGNLFAPLGKIKLGDGTTQGLVLQPGSLTSVTLADTVVPYGATSDGTGWYYNASLSPLSQPPAKGLEFDGASVAIKAGSTIDVRGGGDLQAMEWIQGKGGSHDTLTSINGGLGTGSGAGSIVYALLPTRNDPTAAFDINFTAATGLNAAGNSGTPFKLPSGQVLYLQSGDVYPLAGSQITIDGGAGIPGGTYTLYPAHYATLPGALRVVDYGDNLGRNVPSGTKLPDGTVLVTGYNTQSTQPGKRSSGQSLFAVQTSAVWQQYSEYSFSSANKYFAQKATLDGTTVPRLPMEAGRLAVNAQQQILLAGTALSQPAPGGRGGELDITGDKLAVVSHQQYVDGAAAGGVPAGYIPLDVSQVDNLAFESVLIGGTRSDVDPTKGTQINPTATSVLVDTRGEKLTAPEILLVTQATGQWQNQNQWFQVGSTWVYVPLALYRPSANDGSIVIKAGSIIETTGTVHAGLGRSYYLANGTPAPTPLSRALEVAQSLGGTLQPDGSITDIDLNKFQAFWYWNDFKSWTSTPGLDATSLDYYAFGGPTTKQPGLGALFAASNDPTLVLSGPTGTPVPPLTLKFTNLKPGVAPGVPDSGPVTALDGSPAQIVVPGSDVGRVTIEAGTTISTNTLTLQATASTTAIAINGNLHAQQFNLAAQTFAIGQGSTSAIDSSVHLSGGELGTEVQRLTLKSLSGAISLYGNFDAGPAVTSLTLDTAAVLRAGSGDGKITVENGAITLVNNQGLALPAGLPSGSGSLAFEATDIVLGGGTQTIAGSSAVSLNATDRVLIAGPGNLTLGLSTDQVKLAVTTPTILVAGATAAGSFALTTQGDVSLADITARSGRAQRPSDSSEIGGNLAVIAKTITVGNTIQAQAGTVTLEATGADVVNPDGSITQTLRLTDGAYIAAGGYTKTLADTVTYVAGGRVLLQADPANAGSVLTSANSVIDVAQPADGLGYGGQVRISAIAGRAVVLGDLRGRGGNGLGGSFKVDTNSLQVDRGFDPSVKLDVLADRLLSGGLSGAIDIHARTGNLTLSAGHTLKGNSVTLTADDATWDIANPTNQFGQVTLAGKIDASGYTSATADGTGQAGGQVSLYGANQVTLAGTSFIDASTAHTDERGGDVMIGIPWAANGKIRLQTGMSIDVSGGTKGGLSGGTVTFRAPNDGNGNAKIVQFDAAGRELSTFSGIDIRGARAVTVESFVAFDTKASRYGLDGSSLRWDGQVDPAGAYDASGNKVLTGSWTGIPGFQLKVTNGGGGYQQPPTVLLNFDFRTRNSVIAVMGLDGVTPLSLTTTGATLAANRSFPVTFDAPTNHATNVTNRVAQGIASTDANGVVTSILITDPGSGYTGVPLGAHITTAQGTVNATVTGGGLQVVSLAVEKSGTYSQLSVFMFGGGGRLAQGTAVQTLSLTGMTTASGFQLDQHDAFLSAIPDPSAPTSTEIFHPIGPHTPFFDVALPEFSQGTWTYNNQNYGFQNLISSLSPLAQQLGAGVVHVRPGIELVNSDPSTNSGNITVKDVWNLAAGSTYNLQPNVQPDNTLNGNKYVHVYDSNAQAQQSYVTFDYRLVADYGNGPAIEPGALTLRSLNNIVIGASISDGFFQFRNYLDPTYVAALATYLSANGTRTIDQSDGADNPHQYYLNTYLQSPTAPYQASANVISPSAQNMAAADLFPNQLNVCVAACGTANSVGTIPQGAKIVTVTDPGSWAYRITAGADLWSGNPNAVRPLGSTTYNPTNSLAYNLKDPGRTPSVILTGQASYTQYLHDGLSAATVNLPTMVRTGTGSVNVTAAYNVFLNDPDPNSPTANTVAPGVIYAAGVNAPRLAGPNYQLQTANGVTQVVATATSDQNELFFEPQLLGYGNALPYGPPTAAAFPHMGGDVQVAAQVDIVGYSPATSTTSKTSYQYYNQWLLADAGLKPAGKDTASSISLRGEGVFAQIGTSIASQTAWWIQYGSFQQGILSAGGNVTAAAGRDVVDLSVSLPATGRVSGGIAATSTPVTHVYDSGNMSVSAGRDILGGSFYEGSGHASIVAGRTVGQTTEKLSWQGLDRTSAPLSLDNVPLLAVDLGRIQLTAGGSISISGVVNPPALHRQSGTFANVASGGAYASPDNLTAIYMDTYGPQSGVGLLSVTGNVTIGIAPTAINSSTSSVYPASFEAVALRGDIKTTGLQGTGILVGFPPIPGMILSGSETGDFQLLAGGSVDLTFGASPNALLKPYISAGPSLLDKAFDPFRPDAWYGSHPGDASYAGPFSSPVLSHQNDTSTAEIIAATGNIVGSGSTALDTQAVDTKTGTNLTRVEINRPTEVYAGGNITDLNMIVQNIRPSDVSSVVAVGNITYTGLNIAGGLQVAGPGFFVVQAGGDLGPFLPVTHDTTTEVLKQQGIASVGNTSSIPVGNAFFRPAASGGLTGIYDAALLGPYFNANKRRNALLGTTGSDIVALFGVAKGIDYKAVVDAYIDPKNAASVAHNYFNEMLAFLARVNTPAGSDPLTTFTSLPESLQHTFIDQVFFAELKAVGQSDQGKAATPRGYQMTETMFPSSYGYTANDGGSLVNTGDLNLLHATIQTRQGGDISIFGPGGSILVGPLATESNTNLKLSDLGILTLGGGAINTFTDENVLVNSSRVLTTQGGDILMWSSNGDLDAGRGSKTTLSLPPLQVFFDGNDYEYIDLGGFVTGAGIGTVQASHVAKQSSLFLLAPRGTVDFGVAGGRSSGNLVVVAPVVVNFSNIEVAGTTTGIPVVSVPNTAGLSTAGSAAAAATKSAETPTASGGNQDSASIFLVEMIGYGGGDGSGSNPAPNGDTSPSPVSPYEQNSDDRKKGDRQ